MAISVDWGSKLITVNQSDTEISFVSGSTYQLDTNAFRLALKALEDDETGIPFNRITKHNKVVTIDGINYVRSWEILNGYTVVCLPDTAWRLRMDGQSNNNFHSEGILILNNVQVIPSNSAGNTVTETGVSGLTAQEATDLTTAASEAELARKLIDANETLVDGQTGNLTVIDPDDGVTVLRTRSVKSKSGGDITIPDDAPASRTKD